jgi:hypothetical protein
VLRPELHPPRGTFIRGTGDPAEMIGASAFRLDDA